MASRMVTTTKTPIMTSTISVELPVSFIWVSSDMGARSLVGLQVGHALARSSNPIYAARMRRLLRALWRWLQIVVPFGLLVRAKPRHYREMLRVAWQNRGRWRYALRILRHGVCDGCSLGPRGLRDDVIPGVHLCLTRLGLLRLNTMGPIPDEKLGDIRALRALGNEGLHRLGRVPAPLLRRPGDPGFTRIGWDEALRLTAEAMRATDVDRMAFFVSSR